MNSIPPEGQEWLPLACLTLGVLLGLIGGLKITEVMLASLRRRLDELERKETPP
jgi:hypothetical protein